MPWRTGADPARVDGADPPPRLPAETDQAARDDFAAAAMRARARIARPMSYDPRTIAFAAEILHPPGQVRADLVQGVHHALFRQPALGYQSFQVQPDGIHLTNLPQAPGQVSSLSFLPDRLTLREELRSGTVEEFATRVVNVARAAFSALAIPASIAQLFTVRSLFSPKHVRDSRELLSQRMLAQGAALSHFGRPLQGLGLRLSLPPHGDDRAMHQVRIESYPQDPRSVWVEVASTFPQPLAQQELPTMADRLYAAYAFLTGPVAAFVAAHDRDGSQ